MESVDELTELTWDETFDQELNHLTNSFAQLKQAQAKFKSCIENVGEVNEKNSGACYRVCSVLVYTLTMS